MRFITSFSGGKDSMLALHRMIKENNDCIGILTTTNEDKGSWFHDIELNILEEIAEQLNIKFFKASLSVEEYSKEFIEKCLLIKKQYPFDAIVFGDIDIKSHREWCEGVCNEIGVKAIFPLWQENRIAIVQEFVELGYKAKIKRIDKNIMDKKYLGCDLSQELIDEFNKLNIDACGENGEYHTLVYDGPLFANKISLEIIDIQESENTFSLKISKKSF